MARQHKHRIHGCKWCGYDTGTGEGGIHLACACDRRRCLGVGDMYGVKELEHGCLEVVWDACALTCRECGRWL